MRASIRPGTGQFVHALNRHGLVGSMGRVGAAGDNAAMQSFFALLQKNVLNRRTWVLRQARDQGHA
jgi:transposase InsO family protein